MSIRIYANLGFLLQIAGLLTILPIGVGLYFEETQSVVGLFIACVTFLGCGFLLNAMCERKDLDFKSSNVLFLAAFIILPLIGALPYFYLDPFSSTNAFERFSNGIFESVSGFTTTGFSFVVNSEALPESLLIYRSLTELMGGVGIVFLLLAFFQRKEKSMESYGNSIGIENVNGNLKKTFLSVLGIYSGYILAFTAIFVALGFTNLINTGTFMIDTITGGFQPSNQQFQPFLEVTPKILLTVLMLLGSLNFAFSYYLFTRKPRKAFSWEIVAFLFIILIGTISFSLLGNFNVVDSLFHVVSMSSSTGFYFIPLSSLSSTLLSILIVLMLIGGCAFSMAGGIRVSRLLSFGKSLRESMKAVLAKEHVIPAEQVTGNNLNDYSEHLSAPIIIILFAVILVIFSVIFTTIGVSFTDALFEVGSALTTNGISMGATNVLMPIGYKWLMIAAMTIGRIEILSILIALSAYRRGSANKTGSGWFHRANKIEKQIIEPLTK
jgi:trk system potassium uptake protein TrkH